MPSNPCLGQASDEADVLEYVPNRTSALSQVPLSRHEQGLPPPPPRSFSQEGFCFARTTFRRFRILRFRQRSVCDSRARLQLFPRAPLLVCKRKIKFAGGVSKNASALMSCPPLLPPTLSFSCPFPALSVGRPVLPPQPCSHCPNPALFR